jgi:hypothetical protein
VAVAAAAATLIARTSPPTPESPSVASWQARAERAERELEAARSRVASLAAQLERLAVRFDALAARFDELARQAAPNATPTDANATEPQTAATPEFQPVSEEEWEALVSGALQSEIERRFGQSLPPERQQRLVDALARVRAAAALMPGEPSDSEDAARPGQHLTRSIILLEADRVFREETGIGVAEFLRSLDAEQVEDVPPATGEH